MSRESIKNFWEQFNYKILNENFKFYPFPLESNCYFSGKINDDSPGSTGKPFIGIDLVNSKNFIRVNVYIPDDRIFYDTLFKEKDEIERSYGGHLQWARECGKKASRIFVEIHGLKFRETSNYVELMNKLIQTVKRFIDTFGNKIKMYNIF